MTTPKTHYYDQWGNLKCPPAKTVEENHNGDFIKIFLYEYTACFYFGYQIKLGKIIQQKKANITDQPLRTVETARIAAQNTIIDICRKNKAMKRIFEDFTVIKYNQQELFD